MLAFRTNLVIVVAGRTVKECKAVDVRGQKDKRE